MDVPVTQQTECGAVVPALLMDAFERKHDALERFFSRRYAGTRPFVYNSVDVRRSGFKIAPVDTNIFPGGFNNVPLHARLRAAGLMRDYFRTYVPGAREILILAENHTRNLFYLENVRVLRDMLTSEGFSVRVSSPARCEEGAPLEAETALGAKLLIEPYRREGGELVALSDGRSADAVLLNNDLSSGVPALLQGLRAPAVPSPEYGWHMRRKSLHFDAYAEAARECALALDVDPWLLAAMHDRCPGVNFKERAGVECVAARADRLLHRIRAKYKEYGVKDEPFVFVKADNGTYGMGVMTVRSGEELFEINRETRKKMDVIKEGVRTEEVIIQEGVPTKDRIDGFSAEPMIYLAAGEVIARCFRYNTERGDQDNLNAGGMKFYAEPEDAPLCPALDLAARLASWSSAWECYSDDYVI